MKLHIEEGSLNYAAEIIEITTLSPIPEKDRIQLTMISGNQVIVSRDVKVGDKMIYFCSGTELAEDYCRENNLFDNRILNADITKKGYISSKRRVRAIKLGGIISDGFLMPISSLEFYGNPQILNEFKVGDRFTSFNNFFLCRKYVVPVRNANPGGSAPEPKIKLGNIMVSGQFRFHFETPHLGRNLEKLTPGAEVVITYKLHGSSIILSRVKILRKLSWKDKVAKLLGVKVIETEFANIYSSGKPKSSLPKGIDSIWTNKNKSFYTNDIWKQAYEDYKYALEDGISLYGELVGNHIQRRYDYLKLIPEGKDYGFLVYRITRTNESGYVDEFSWHQVQEYCQKYSLVHVPFIRKSIVGITEDADALVDTITNEYLEKKCNYCVNEVYAEGVCFRIESPFSVFKLKSKNFLLVEDKQQEEGIENIEES